MQVDLPGWVKDQHGLGNLCMCNWLINTTIYLCVYVMVKLQTLVSIIRSNYLLSVVMIHPHTHLGNNF